MAKDGGMTATGMTHSPGMRPLCKDGILQISRMPLDFPKTTEEETPEETPQETTEATEQAPEQVDVTQPQITQMQNPYLGYAPPTPFFQQGGFAQPSENTGSESQPEADAAAAAGAATWDGSNVQNQTWDPSNNWDPNGMNYHEQQQMYFQQMMMFQQYMFHQNAYLANWNQQQQPYNGRKNWNKKGGKRGRKGNRRRRNSPKNQQNQNQGSEQKPKTETSTLNKDAAVFTPKASMHPDNSLKGDPTKELSNTVPSQTTSTSAEAEPSATPISKPTGPRTYANMVGRQQSTEAKSLLTVDRSRLMKPRGLGAHPSPTKPLMSASPKKPVNPVPAPIAPPKPTSQGQTSPPRVANPAPHPQRRTSPPRPNPIQRPAPFASAPHPVTTSTATATAEASKQGLNSKSSPIWPKVKPSSTKITTTIKTKDSADDLLSESSSQDHKSNESTNTLSSELEAMPKVKTLDMPMETTQLQSKIITSSVSQPQMWSQLASTHQIWAGGPPPTQEVSQSSIVQKPKTSPNKPLKQGDPRAVKDKRVSKQGKRAYPNKSRRGQNRSTQGGMFTW